MSVRPPEGAMVADQRRYARPLIDEVGPSRRGAPWILGLGGSKHDFSACLLRDGEVAVAIEEERVSRKKRGFGVDVEAAGSIGYCLAACELELDDIAVICANDLLSAEMYEHLERPRLVIGHHFCHAASAYYPSGLDEMAILVIDHSGGRFISDAGSPVAETISYYQAAAGEIELVGRVVGEDEGGPVAVTGTNLRGLYGIELLKRPRNSLGRFYARIAKKCDCLTRMGDGELHTESGHMMGLSAYGDDRYYAALRAFVQLGAEGQIQISMGSGEDGVEKFCDRVIREATAGGDQEILAARANLAFAAQKILEEAVLHCARYLHGVTGSKAIGLAGGVCLNAKANHLILEKTAFEHIYVQPASHDAGTALGAAYLGWLYDSAHHWQEPRPPLRPYLGRGYDEKEIQAALSAERIAFCRLEDVERRVAYALSKGRVVGLYQAGSEFGPRALGNRSVLADCRFEEIKEVLNERVKFRLPYRPYAPVCREEDSARYFKMRAHSPHMTLIGYVRPEWRSRLPAITHVDGTARVQTVARSLNPRLYAIIDAFARETGIGVILNTSMNVQGEPIVETPEDALRFLRGTSIDALVMEDFICARSDADLQHVLETGERA